MENQVTNLELQQSLYESYDNQESPTAKMEEPREKMYETDGEDDEEPAIALTKSEHDPSLKYILCEIKQFNICLAKIVPMITKQAPADTEEAEAEAQEITALVEAKVKVDQLYRQLLMTNDVSLLATYIDVLTKAVVTSQTVPSHLLRITIECLTKILQGTSVDFDCQPLANALVRVQLDDSSLHVDMRELMVLQIQELLLLLIGSHDFDVSEVKAYFKEYLQQRGFNSQWEIGQTVHFQEQVKKNFYRLLSTLVSQDQDELPEFCSLLKTALKGIGEQVEKEPVERKAEELERHLKISVYLLRSLMQLLFEDHVSKDSLVTVLEVTCLACEQKHDHQGLDLVRRHAQLLFRQLVGEMMTQNLREELEVGFVRCLIKPVLLRVQKLESDPDAARPIKNDEQLQSCISFIEEMLLCLSPADLGWIMLNYDCQPLSYSVMSECLAQIGKFSDIEDFYVQLLQALSTFEMKTSADYTGAIRRMIDGKATVLELAAQLNKKPKEFVKVCQENYDLDIAAKVLVFSRDVSVEQVTETIGGKNFDDVFKAFLKNMDFSSNDLETSLRLFMQTFLMSGVEAQVIFRVLEGFSYAFFEQDNSGIFHSKEEAYDMAYLIITLQTTMHNPSIRQKLTLKQIMEQAKVSCPESFKLAKLDEAYVERLYDNIKEKTISSPLSRNFMESEYQSFEGAFATIKLAGSKGRQMTVSEFLVTGDLAATQMFKFNNSFTPVEDSDALVTSAVKLILGTITETYIAQGAENADLYQKLLTLNRKLGNLQFLDTILRKIWSRGDCQDEKALVAEIMANFDKGAKQTISLVPQILIGRYDSCTFSSLDQAYLLEIFQASERHCRNQVVRTQNQLQREVYRLEGKSPEEIEELMKGHIHKKESEQASGLLSIVYNYFGASNEEAKTEHQEKQEAIQRYRMQMDKLKKTQTDHMKFMNKLYQSISSQHPSYKEVANPDQTKKPSDMQEFINKHFSRLLLQLLTGLRETLFQQLKTRDGLFTLLLIKHFLTASDDRENAADLELIWQEMHLIMSKLTQTKRKVGLLRRAGGMDSSFSSGTNSNLTDDEALDSARSLETSEASTAEASTESTVASGAPIKLKVTGSKTERLVFENLNKHFVLDLFFEVNRRQTSLMFKEDGEEALAEIQNCMREVWRIFKSLVHGPKAPEEDTPQFEQFLDTDISLMPGNDQAWFFDQMHFLIKMNQLLAAPRDAEKTDLPLLSYGKLFKLLKNLLIYSISLLESVQMEVFASNSDAFINLEDIALTYLRASDVVHSDVCQLLAQLIDSYTTKSELFGIQLKEFDRRHFNLHQLAFLAAKGDQFETWLSSVALVQDLSLTEVAKLLEVKKTQEEREELAKKLLITPHIDYMVGLLDKNAGGPDKMLTAYDRLFLGSCFDAIDLGQQRNLMLLHAHLQTSTSIISAVLEKVEQNPKDDQVLFLRKACFAFLKSQLVFMRETKKMGNIINSNLKQIMKRLIQTPALLGEAEADTEETKQAKAEILTAMWASIGKFFPGLKDKLNS